MIAPPAAPDAGGEQGGALTLIAQALLAAAATGTAPGFVLGTLLFVQALVGVLVLVGVDDMARWARSLIVLLGFATGALILLTGQGAFFGLGLALLAAAYVQLGPAQSSVLVRAGGFIAAALGIAFAAVLLAGRLGHAPPGWWAERRVPWLEGEIIIPLPPPLPNG